VITKRANCYAFTGAVQREARWELFLLVFYLLSKDENHVRL